MLELRVSPKTAAVWKRHLNSADGDLGMQALRLRVPVPNGAVPDKIAFDAGRVAGYDECLRNILDLMEEYDELQDSNLLKNMEE